MKMKTLEELQAEYNMKNGVPQPEVRKYPYTPFSRWSVKDRNELYHEDKEAFYYLNENKEFTYDDLVNTNMEYANKKAIQKAEEELAAYRHKLSIEF